MANGQRERAEAFRALHHRDGEPLRLLNAWDAGSATVLVAAGAPALGTTSAGVAFALGLPDGARATIDGGSGRRRRRDPEAHLIAHGDRSLRQR